MWFDAILRHRIYSMRVGGSIRNSVNEILDATEADIARRIRDALRGDVVYTPSRLAKAQAALKRIRVIRSAAWAKSNETLSQGLIDFMKHEGEYFGSALETVVPVVLQTALPSTSLLKSLVKSKPFEGRTLKEWASTLQKVDLRRIEDQVKIGLVRGEDSDAIARRIVGTVALKGRDGALQVTRNNAEAIVRTAVNAFSNTAHEEFLKENSDLFDEEIFVATLDSRTTPLCRSLDGEKYPVGEGPIPPLHFNCRSMRVASINGEALGMRPAKPFTERMMVQDYAKQEGLGDISSRDKLPRGAKGGYDDYASKRIREMTGQVPAKTTYQDWLSGQSAAFQNDVLGPTRGKLFRSGGLELRNFVDRSGGTTTLSDLAAKDASAFKAAGLDPGEFL
jgi:SPP1 gp7 family putative phage head morphogenesis protein